MISLTLALLLTTSAAPATAKDCGTDLNCFIKAAGTCARAKVRSTQTLDLMGMQQTTTTLMVIEGPQGGKCRLVQTVEKAEAHLSAEALKAFKAQNPDVSKAEIRKGEEDQNRALQSQTGKPQVCQFATRDLVEVLTHTRDGAFNSREWAAGCPAAQGSSGEPVLRLTK